MHYGKSIYCHRNLSSESFGVIFYAAALARPPVSPLIKPRDITKEFQQKTIQCNGIFHGLKITT